MSMGQKGAGVNGHLEEAAGSVGSPEFVALDDDCSGRQAAIVPGNLYQGEIGAGRPLHIFATIAGRGPGPELNPWILPAWHAPGRLLGPE